MSQFFARFGVWRRRIGLVATTRWLLLRLRRKMGIPEPNHMRIRPKRSRFPLTVRLGRSSDIEVFRQIFVEEEYFSLRDLTDVRMVLDLGANVGYSSSYFLSCFPGARVIAVEPDERNFEICCHNLKPYGERACVLHGAVWDRQTKLCVSKGTFGDGREWATEVVDPPSGCSGDVQAWDLFSLIELAKCDTVDLLKMDIERSELTVFKGNTRRWLPKVRNLCVELHGADCQSAFFEALSGFEYKLEYSGELTVLKNIQAAH